MYCPLCRTTVTENMGHSCVKVAPVPDWSKMFPNLNEKYSDLLQSHSSLCGEIEQKSAYIRELTDALEGTRKERDAALLQNGVLLTYIERVRKNVSSDNICDCHGRIGEPHKKDCLLIALYALDGCICVKFGGFGGIHLDDCPGKKVESLGAGLTDESQREANKLKAEVDRWVERSRVAEDKGHESNWLYDEARQWAIHQRDIAGRNMDAANEEPVRRYWLGRWTAYGEAIDVLSKTEKRNCEHVFTNYQCDKCGTGQETGKRDDCSCGSKSFLKNFHKVGCPLRD